MSMYEDFQTDPDLERNGVELEYDDYRITIARAGGANKKYEKMLEAKMKPHRRAILNETMKNERALAILKDVYSHTVVLNWEAKDENGDFEVGIEPPPSNDPGVDTTSLLPVTPANVHQAFLNLPELFDDLRAQASGFALFRMVLQQADAGN